MALKVWKVYNLIKQRRFTEAYNEDTLLWVVFGILFGLIVTGILLMLLRGELETALRSGIR